MAIHEMIGQSDEWYTPGYVFDALECTFDTDVASPIDRRYCSVPASRFITAHSLDLDWNGFVWMNPPFGGRNALMPWLNKMHKHGNGIALTPDRTSAPWWQDAVSKADGVLFVSKKIKFIRPDGSLGNQPGNGTTLFGYGKRALIALGTAHKNKLGTLLFNT